MKQCAQFGCGFLVSLKMINAILEFKSQSPRIATLTFKAANKIYTIINVHAPTNEKNSKRAGKEDVQKFWELLDQTLVNCPEKHVKILVGDFNAQLGREKKFRDVIGKWTAHTRTNKNGLRVIDICRDNNLVSKSTCFKRQPHRLKTWKHPDYRRGEWQLDHVFMDKWYHKEIQNVKVLRGTDTGSDHYIVKIKIKLTPLKMKKSPGKPKRRFDPALLINNEEFKKRTREESGQTQTLEELVSKLKRIAEEVAPMKPRKKHQWWNMDCDLAVEERHQAWIRHQAQKSEDSNLALINQRRSTSKIIRNAKRNYHKQTLNQIQDDFERKKSRNYYKTFGKYLKKYEAPTLMLKDQNGNLAHNNIDNARILAETFEKLLNCDDPPELLDVEMDTQIFSEAHHIEPPTIEEVSFALSELKNYKACGEDQVFAEMWKNADWRTTEDLHKHLVRIWEEEKLPEHWTMGVIHPLFKKGDKTNPDNYRGITLLDCTYKVLSRIVLNKIKNTLEPRLGEYQGGFRPYRSCSDQILSLKLIMEDHKIRNKQLFITFVDFRKAYDCIHRPTLLKILRNYGLHIKLVKMIQLTLTNTKSRVKFRGELSDPFTIKTGLRQGDGLSPILFNIALDYIMKIWQKENQPKVRVGRNIRVNCLGFADDLALLALDMEEVRTQISSLESIAGKIGLRISYEKTEIMAMDPLCISNVKMNNKEVKLVQQFKYLGGIISCNLNEKAEWQNKITKMRRAQGLTWQTYRKKCLSIRAKIRHYNTVTLPETLYACETLFQIKAEAKTDPLVKVERRIIRTCLNKSYEKDGCWRIATNESVYREVEPVISVMKKRRIAYFFHILRMPESRLLKQLVCRNLTKKIKGKYVGEVEKDLREIGLTLGDADSKDKIKNKLKSEFRFSMERTRRAPVVYSVEERMRRSERMKLYWRNKRENLLRRN